MKQAQYKRPGPVDRSRRQWRRFAQMFALVVFAQLIPGVSSAASSCATNGNFLERLCEVDATDEAGVVIPLQPGVWYTLQVYMGSWQAHSWGGPLLYNGWVKNNSGIWYRMATDNDSNDVDHHWPDTFVDDMGDGYYQMTWRATTSSIRFRVADAPTKFGDNSGVLYLWLAPLQ